MGIDHDNDKSLHEKIGYMRADIKNVDRKIDEVKDAVADLSDKAVTQSECTQRTKAFTNAVGSLREDIARKQTRTDHPAVYPSLDTIVERLSEVVNVESQDGEEPVERSLISRLKDHIGLIAAIVGLLTLLSAGLVKLSHFIVKVDSAIVKSEKMTKETHEELQKELQEVKKSANQLRYIYVQPPLDVSRGQEK
jgi:hypothetical protein